VLIDRGEERLLPVAGDERSISSCVPLMILLVWQSPISSSDPAPLPPMRKSCMVRRAFSTDSQRRVRHLHDL